MQIGKYTEAEISFMVAQGWGEGRKDD